jgi:hypothetical protein
MSITQTVEVPANHRLTIDVPREVPTGPVVLIFKPITETGIETGEQASTDEALASARGILEKHRGAFEALAK